MSELEFAEWIWPRIKDRLERPASARSGAKWRWLLDGKRADAFEVWNRLIEPVLEQEENRPELSFPKNYWNITMVVANLRTEWALEQRR